jgi:hypothetical protein
LVKRVQGVAGFELLETTALHRRAGWSLVFADGFASGFFERVELQGGFWSSV